MNASGKLLMYIATAMQIVNGRIGTDKGGGMMTCTTYRGESVVDYVLTDSDFNISVILKLVDLTFFLIIP